MAGDPPRASAAGSCLRPTAVPDKEADRLVELCLAAVEANVVVIAEVVYVPLEDEARARSVRDPNDWPLVACALVLDAAIWTADNDLLGTGVATWTTDTLRAWLGRHEGGGPSEGG